MIVPDLNLLLYAHNQGSTRHSAARHWWANLLQGDETVGIPWVVATGFIRLMSSPALLEPPLLPPAAAAYVQHWLRHDHILALNPTDNHLAILSQYLQIPGSGPNIVTDAHIAALAFEHDATVHTADSDFSRFPGLIWTNPLPAL